MVFDVLSDFVFLGARGFPGGRGLESSSNSSACSVTPTGSTGSDASHLRTLSVVVRFEVEDDALFACLFCGPFLEVQFVIQFVLVLVDLVDIVVAFIEVDEIDVEVVSVDIGVEEIVHV
nr:hypothetical protein [Tanacetum cinerariifolium]